MTSIRASSLLSSSSSSSSKRVNIFSIPKLLPRISLSFRNASTRKQVHQSKASINIIPLDANANINHNFYNNLHNSNDSNIILQLYTILEAVSDRIEMHHNVGEQRDGWNALLLNSINMITLAATTMSGVAAAAAVDASAPLKLSSTVLFSAATASLLVMNKIQPSQLAEEQRIAARLFTQLRTEIEIAIALGTATEEDVKVATERILAIDRAYPLPLLGGAMIEKFPSKFEPAIWWPPNNKSRSISSRSINPNQNNNGWSEEMEDEMREIIEVIKRKDMEDYDRLGNIALKMNKMLAISGPILTGIAALTNSEGSWGSVVAVVAGALASAINAIEHGGQVGMVLEMYRNCGGFFKLLEETVEATLEEKNYERRENGEIFEMKVALQLGRSVSQLREFASKAALCRMEGTEIDEFASKLF